MRGRQRGVALISVLLVMSLALLIVGGLLRSQRLLLQSSGQQLHHVSVRQLGAAGESFALSRLAAAAQPAQRTVDLTQAWAHPNTGFGAEDTQVRVVIEDLSGRFNLNTLLVKGKVAPVTLERWRRLQALLGLPALQLQQVGALSELSQLRLLPGVDQHRLRQLQPWVAMLPPQATLNINTAPALLLRTLEGVDADVAEALTRQRTTVAWQSAQAFAQDPLLTGANVNSQGLGVGSRWYRIRVHASQGQSTFRSATDVELNPETRHFKVLARRVLPSIDNEISP